MSLFLVGMRGAGKSVAGALAAERLGVPFLDADAAIELRAGQSVGELFLRRGEPAFRELERMLLLELLPVGGRIVATGGGAVTDTEVRTALRRHGCVVWLEASVATLRARIAGSRRPSLTGGACSDEVESVLRAREPLYRALCDARVDTTTCTVSEVADVLEQLWKTLPHQQLR